MTEHKINLLIVDDEEQLLNSIKRSLEVREFNVYTANRGDKALQVAREVPVDIALVDLKMPGMDGEETLRELKKEHQWMEVVILTGHGSVESAVECTKSGAHTYLQKPCRLEELLGALKDAFKKRVMNKNNIKEKMLNEILQPSLSQSPREILRRLKAFDRNAPA